MNTLLFFPVTVLHDVIIAYNKIATISWELAVYQTLCELQDQYLVKSTIKQKKFLVKFYQWQLTRMYCPDQYTIRFMSCCTASKAKCVREDTAPLHVSWLQCSALKTHMRFRPEYNLCTVTSHSLTQQPFLGGRVFSPVLSTCCLPRPHTSELHLQRASLLGSAAHNWP